jgi:predicted RNA-binding Zn-ribbon protein involved in translation (DUF1610 family)
MPRYRVTNRRTNEAYEVEAPYAADACTACGWMIGHCHVELLREGPFSDIDQAPAPVNAQGKRADYANTIDGILASGGLDGYEQRAPDPGTAEEDSAMVRAWECPNCGHVGLTYRPFTKRQGHRNHFTGEWAFTYRAFAECPVCKYAEEF